MKKSLYIKVVEVGQKQAPWAATTWPAASWPSGARPTRATRLTSCRLRSPAGRWWRGCAPPPVTRSRSTRRRAPSVGWQSRAPCSARWPDRGYRRTRPVRATGRPRRSCPASEPPAGRPPNGPPAEASSTRRRRNAPLSAASALSRTARSDGRPETAGRSRAQAVSPRTTESGCQRSPL